MYSYIDTGERFKGRQDRMDPDVISTRSHDLHLGYTGFSLDDFNVVLKNKSSSFKKRFALDFNIWSHKTLKVTFLEPISGVCNAMYTGMFSLLIIIPQ